VILAVPWSGEFGSELFGAAYLAHRRSGMPLVVYEMDEWRASLGPASGRVSRMLERLFHAPLLRAADSVWAISAQMADEFRRRFDVAAGILPNCVDVEQYSTASGRRTRNDEFRILFTGAVYGAQADAIRNVLQAIQAMPTGRFSLVLHTSQKADELAALGIAGLGLRIEPPVPLAAMPQLLATADALLLPYSFDSQQRGIVSTAFPSKTADYLASGVPVLVHAPEYATIALAARSEGWGLVVDRPDIALLQRSIAQLAGDNVLRDQLTEAALRTAWQRHDLSSRRAEFLESLARAAER
jgi:glycosyltransferase involved in cell wall biosynthesis